MGRGNESLVAAPGSHYQDGRHAHIWFNPLKNIYLQLTDRLLRNSVCYIGDSGQLKFVQMMTLD